MKEMVSTTAKVIRISTTLARASRWRSSRPLPPESVSRRLWSSMSTPYPEAGNLMPAIVSDQRSDLWSVGSWVPGRRWYRAGVPTAACLERQWGPSTCGDARTAAQNSHKDYVYVMLRPLARRSHAGSPMPRGGGRARFKYRPAGIHRLVDEYPSGARSEGGVGTESPSQARMHGRLGRRLPLGGLLGAIVGAIVGALVGLLFFDRPAAILTSILASAVFGLGVGMLVAGYSSLESPDPGAGPPTRPGPSQIAPRS
jgi:hypothetical protein